MCTVIPMSENGKPHIAEKDIEVFKIGYINNEQYLYNEKDPQECEAAFIKGFKYIKGVVVKTNFSTTRTTSYFDNIEADYKNSLENPVYVATGFHALTTYNKERLHLSRGWIGISKKIAYLSFIIPAGAFYYKNKADCIVSDQIIFNKLIEYQ